MTACLRVAVLGSDSSALAFTAFLKHKRKHVILDIFPASAGLCHDIPDRGVMFSSMSLRNDPKGRRAIMYLGREILGIPEKEFVVSNVKNSTKIGSEIFPSFISAVRNAALVLEPFRGRHKSIEDISIFEFFKSRFGSGCARRYADVISRAITGGENSGNISVNSIFPKMVMNAKNNSSVLLGPLLSIFSSSQNFKPSNVDVLDHLWQELMAGGKHVSFSHRLDLSVLREELVKHVSSLPDVRVSPNEQVNSLADSYDIIVTSSHPKTVWDLMASEMSPPDWLATLCASRNTFSTRIIWENFDGPRSPVSSIWSADTVSKVIGAICQSWVFPSESAGRLIIDVFSSEHLGDAELLEFLRLKSSFPVHRDPAEIIRNSEEIPATPLGHPDALYQLNKYRVSKSALKSKLQFLGKWYYCPTGSLTDIIADAESLANLVVDRYASFPAVENERSDDWINRSEKSLDLMYAEKMKSSKLSI